jgi:CheY-like chemotaxis protein
MSRILVVEDDYAVTNMLVSFLQSLGYEPIAVDGGLEMLKRAESLKPDAIILDLMMPGMTGAEAAFRLRRNPETRDIPILAITALEHVDDLEDVLMVDDVLTKPFDLDVLELRLRWLTSRVETSSALFTEGTAAQN